MRTRAGSWLAGLCRLVGGALFISCAHPTEPKGPNLLLITVDTLRADALEPYGSPPGSTPAIARLAREAVVFDDAQSAASWTLPSFASLFTSQPVSTHGCADFRVRLSDSFETLAEMLVRQGWDTAAVISQIVVGRRHGLDQGFVHFDDAFVCGDDPAEQRVSSPYVTEQAQRFLEAKAAAGDGRPWFLWLHLFDPHAAYQLHPGFGLRVSTGSDVEKYTTEVGFTDAHVGRVLDTLDKLGLAADTVVVLTSDHGEEFGEHGGRGHAHSLYAELVHVPLVVRAPGIAPRRVSATVRSIDVYPTLCELLGLPIPATLAGESFLGAMRGGTLEQRAALAEMQAGGTGKSSLVLGAWKLIQDPATSEVELYQRSVDPREATDVADKEPEVVRDLTARLKAEEARAVEGARAFGRASEVVLGVEEVEELRALGYVGQ
jgi:arylsulfatase A-like enzyme